MATPPSSWSRPAARAPGRRLTTSAAQASTISRARAAAWRARRRRARLRAAPARRSSGPRRRLLRYATSSKPRSRALDDHVLQPLAQRRLDRPSRAPAARAPRRPPGRSTPAFAGFARPDASPRARRGRSPRSCARSPPASRGGCACRTAPRAGDHLHLVLGERLAGALERRLFLAACAPRSSWATFGGSARRRSSTSARARSTCACSPCAGPRRSPAIAGDAPVELERGARAAPTAAPPGWPRGWRPAAGPRAPRRAAAATSCARRSERRGSSSRHLSVDARLPAAARRPSPSSCEAPSRVCDSWPWRSAVLRALALQLLGLRSFVAARSACSVLGAASAPAAAVERVSSPRPTPGGAPRRRARARARRRESPSSFAWTRLVLLALLAREAGQLRLERLLARQQLQAAVGERVELDLAHLGLEPLVLLGLLRLALERVEAASTAPATMSVTRSRFCSVVSIFRSAALRRALYLVTPAASSMKARRSSGRAETICPTRPCSMIE